MKWTSLAILVLGASIFLLVRFQLLAIPLERDEGCFAYIGHWMFQGKELYTDLGDNKPPLLYALYSLITFLFGYNATGIHLGLLISNVIAAFLLYRLTTSLFEHTTGIYASAFFLVLISGSSILGFAAHATQLLLPFLIGGCLLYVRGLQMQKGYYFFIAGMLISLAVLVKQQAALFGIFLALHFWYDSILSKADPRIAFRRWILLGIGGLLPVILVIIYFALTSRMDDLIFWTYEQPTQLASVFRGSTFPQFISGTRQASEYYWLTWLAALAGTILMILKSSYRKESIFAVLFMLTALISVMIGVGFYRHYYVVLIPGIALGAGMLLHWIEKNAGNKIWMAPAIAFLLLATPVLTQADYYFHPDYHRIHQSYYFQNMFPEMELLGRELSSRIPTDQPLAILGSEPEILVAAKREGCTKHLMTYTLLIGLDETEVLQEKYLQEMRECDPQYVVFNVFSSSWIPGFENLPIHQKNMEWITNYFILEGVAEYREGKEGLILWGDAARNHQPQSPYLIYVFRRK